MTDIDDEEEHEEGQTELVVKKKNLQLLLYGDTLVSGMTRCAVKNVQS